MKQILAVALFLLAAPGTQGAFAQMTPDQVRQAEIFATAVKALDPHTEKSELALQALVAQYVPNAGRVQVFQDFLIASGFDCLPEAEETGAGNVRVFYCRFQPDLGPSAEPSLSSVTEKALFYATAKCNEKNYIMSIGAFMMHGFVGP